MSLIDLSDYCKFIFTRTPTSEDIDRLQDKARLDIYHALREKSKCSLEDQSIKHENSSKHAYSADP